MIEKIIKNIYRWTDFLNSSPQLDISKQLASLDIKNLLQQNHEVKTILKINNNNLKTLFIHPDFSGFLNLVLRFLQLT